MLRRVHKCKCISYTLFQQDRPRLLFKMKFEIKNKISTTQKDMNYNIENTYNLKRF
jgi:hypothetical protein